MQIWLYLFSALGVSPETKGASSDRIIGSLAFVTIGLVIALSVYHFGTFLKDPRNRGHAKNALIDDGKSATTKIKDADTSEHADQPLKIRLDRSDASARPADPAR